MKKERKNYDTQVIVAPTKEQFIIAKNFKQGIDIVSTFNKNGIEYSSDFTVPNNRAFRVQEFFNLIPNLSEYKITDKYVQFNCLKHLPTKLFNNKENGYIHFRVTTNKEKSENGKTKVSEIVVTPKMIFEFTSPQIVEIPYKIQTSFKTQNLKVFPIILEQGFMIAIADKNECIITMSIKDPSKEYIGSCLRREVNNITKHVFPIWPIFNIFINNKDTEVKIVPELIEEFKNENGQILLSFSYSFDNPEVVIASKIGVGFEPNID